MQTHQHPRLGRLPVVLGLSSLKRSTCLALVKAGKFPAPIQIGQRAVAWVLADVDAWVDARIAASRAGGAK